MTRLVHNDESGCDATLHRPEAEQQEAQVGSRARRRHGRFPLCGQVLNSSGRSAAARAVVLQCRLRGALPMTDLAGLEALLIADEGSGAAHR
jgi:hypothetical protein